MLLEPLAAVIPLILVIVGTAESSLTVPEILVHRMQQLDVNGVKRGCQSSLMSLEARTFRSFRSQTGSFARKCVLVRVLDILSDGTGVDELLNDAMVGGLLIILPEPDDLVKLSKSQLAGLVELEKDLLALEPSQKPIYFVQDSAILKEKYEQIDQISSQPTADSSPVLVQYLNTVLSNAFHLVTSVPVTAIKDPILTNIEAKLTGHGNEDQLPTIVLSAYYDAFGVAPGLSFGANENASGLVALLKLARIFGRLYGAQRAQARANLIFLLSAAGKQNFLGTKKYIEQHIDNRDNSPLSEALFVMSLEALATGPEQKDLYMHVSKVPKDKTAMANFFKALQEASTAKTRTSTMINKKINLAEETLSFEHERFAFRRLPAFTITGLQSHRGSMRASIFDGCDSVDLESLATNVEIIAEALASQVFPQLNRTKKEFAAELKVSRPYLKSTFAELCSVPRSQQLLLSRLKGKTSGNNNYEVAPFVQSLEVMIKKSVRNTALLHANLEREPELVFYDPSMTTLYIYDVKHALFDLIISVGIAAYLLALYLFLTNFERLTTVVKFFKAPNENASNGVAATKTKRKNVKSS